MGAALDCVAAETGPDLAAVMPVDISFDADLLAVRRALGEATG